MTVKRVIEILNNEIECVKSANVCLRDCGNCYLVLPEDDILEAYQLAINILSQLDNDTGYVGIDEDYPVSIKQVLNITAETGALETQRRVKELQRYAQLEPPQVARDIATIIKNEQDMRVIQKNAEIEELERKNFVLLRLINEMLEEQQECKET